ncbi:MAG: lytic murein transglycosylase, partial [Pseudomonadota bacterium]
MAIAPLAACAATPPPPERPTAAARTPGPDATAATTGAAAAPAADPAAAPATAAEPVARPANTPTATPTPAATAPAAAALPAGAGFAAWRQAFRTRALGQGIAPATFDAAFQGVSPNPRVVELDRFQPEFVRPIWDYLDSAVSSGRIETGQNKRREKAALMAEIETRHGVDTEIVLAIWGLESAYGFNYGSMSVIRSLATLAHDGRRRDFAEEQLIAALRIIQDGDIAPARMVGSWSGAMGHTQFIPTSFRAYAVDHDGDGRRNVWAEDAADALASAANYLARFGWTRGAPAAVEVTLPPGFDFAAAAGSRRDAGDWTRAGVRTVRGTALPASDGIEIIVPAGADGPAFAAYPNFRVIKRYNNATSYAL